MFAGGLMPKILGFLLVAVLSAVTAFAQEVAGKRGEAYAEPSYRELGLTSLMLEAFDSSSNETIDEFAKLMYCPLYQEKYKSDFEWNNVRQELGRKLLGKREYFRTHYEISGTVYLGRYSFETQDFPFIKKTALVNVGSLTLLSVPAGGTQRYTLCGGTTPSPIFPTSYVFVLQQPLTLDRLKMPMDEAEALLRRMDLMNNKERALYIRFRMRLLGVGNIYNQGVVSTMIFRGELTSIDIFYDREMTKHFAVVSVK
jgi:hypothetical protein